MELNSTGKRNSRHIRIPRDCGWPSITIEFIIKMKKPQPDYFLVVI